MRTGRRNEAGFTLIELLVVVTIIGIIAGMAVGQYHRSIQKAKEATLKQDLYIMRTSIGQYFADKGKYPDSLMSLVEDSYIRQIPIDPITGSPDTWLTEYAQMDEKDITTEPGIADVKSGAGGISLDGTSYSEW